MKSATEEVATTEGVSMDLEITEDAVEAPVEVIESDIRKEMTDLRKELTELRVEKQRIEAEREVEKAVEAAHAWAVLPEMNPTEFAPVLVALRKAAPETAMMVEGILTAAATALSEAGIFKEIGTVGADVGADAWSKIEAMANDMVANGSATSFAKAVSVVASKNMDLYSQYLTEKGN